MKKPVLFLICLALCLALVPYVASTSTLPLPPLQELYTPTPMVTPSPTATPVFVPDPALAPPSVVAPIPPSTPTPQPAPMPSPPVRALGTDTWTTGGPYGGNVYAIAVDPSNNNVIYIGTDNGVFKSTDAGANWTAAGLGSKAIRALALRPGTPSTIYVGTWGVYKSTDSGANWTAMDTGLPPYTDVRCFAFDSANPGIIYLAANNGVFKSTNGGSNWVATGLTLDINTLAFHQGTLYAGTWWNGFYRSTDGGDSWEALNSGLSGGQALTIRTIAISPANPDTIYIGTWYGGTYRSTTGGGNWVSINNGLPSFVDLLKLIVDPNNPNVLYAATHAYFNPNPNERGIFKSTDGGDSWSPINTGLTSLFVFTLALVDTSTIYAGTDGGGIFKSLNSGDNWAMTNMGLLSLQVNALALDTTALYAGTSSGVFKSTDKGGSWIAANTGLTDTLAYALAYDGGALYAGTATGIFKSSNSAGQWAPINNGLTNTDVRSLASIDGVLCAGTTNGGLFESTDGGANWAAINAGIPVTATIYSLAAQAGTLYAGASTGIYKLNGGTWTSITSGLPSPNVRSIAVISDTLCIATVGRRGGYESGDEGTTWEGRDAGMTSNAVYSLIADRAFSTQEPAMEPFVAMTEGGAGGRFAKDCLQHLHQRTMPF